MRLAAIASAVVICGITVSGGILPKNCAHRAARVEVVRLGRPFPAPVNPTGCWRDQHSRTARENSVVKQYLIVGALLGAGCFAAGAGAVLGVAMGTRELVVRARMETPPLIGKSAAE